MRHSSGDVHGSYGKMNHKLSTGLMTALCIFSAAILSPASHADSRKAIKKELSKPEIRGGIVFKNYCALCHGERADGIARATKLYGAANLSIKPATEDYYFKIIRGGGISVGKSDFMPPWKEELSAEQLSDVVAYLKIATNTIRRGEVVFKTNCILCHGIHADGKGRAAKLYDPPPANLTKSDKNDDYKRMIITMGGAAMGRSEVMPIWGEQITKQEIEDVVAYLHTVLVHN